MPETSIALPVAYRLDRYEIMRVLGFGGFGITYLAQEQDADDRVAIKEYFPGDIAARDGEGTVRTRDDGDASVFEWGLKRFMREAETIARFNHPNIVGVRRFFSANGTAYMVMDYEEGVSLGDIVERHGALDASEIFEILGPLLDGLEKVHAAGVLHRDIKPDNIYLRNDGSPILLDFGAARLALGRRSLSVHQVFTPGFAPPEQYQAESDQGPWTDVYGMAAVLYSLVAGRAPVEAPRRTGALIRGDEDPLEPASVIGAGAYPAAFLAAVDWGLRIPENERPQTIAEWRAALFADGVEVDEAETDEAGMIAERVRGEARDPRASDEVITRIQPDRPARRNRVAWILVGAFAVVALGAAGGWYLAWNDTHRSVAAPAGAPAAKMTAGSEQPGLKDLSPILAEAPDGVTLLLRPGRYRGGFVISRGITVRGTGDDPSAVMVIAERGSCVTFRGSGGLENVTLLSLGLGGSEGCVRVEAGDPKIVGNRIRSRGGPGIVVLGGRPLIAGNVVSRNGGPGVRIRGGTAAPRIERNSLFGNAASGLVIGPGAGGQIVRNQIMRNRHHGIWIRGGSRVRVENNRVYDNHGYGVVAERGTGADVIANTLIGNRAGPMRRHTSARGTVERNITR